MKNNMSNAFLELAGKRFSCREFDSRPVSGSDVSKILDAARLAPTARNMQPVHVWALRSEDALSRIRPLHTLFDAPLVFMVGYKADEAAVRNCDGKNWGDTDASIVGTHLMLEAADLDLGCTWVGSFDPAKVLEAFPETEGYEVTALFAVGYPAVNAEPSERHSIRKGMEEFATEL